MSVRNAYERILGHFQSPSPTGFLARAVGGSVVSAGALWAFLAIADAVPERGAMVRADVAIAAYVERATSETGERVFALITTLGSAFLFALIAVASIILLRKRKRHAVVAIVYSSAGGLLLNYVLKALLHRKRPDYATEFANLDSWSFPSGHAMNSVIGYGFLAYLLLDHYPAFRHRRPFIAAVVVMILLIGFSRIYLGVHFLSDVIGGFLAGIVWLVTCIAGYRFTKPEAVIRV